MTGAAAGARAGLLRPVEDAAGVVGYRSAELEARGIPHLFTTRAFDVRSLDGELGDSLRALLGCPGRRLVDLRQVHGATVHFDGGQAMGGERPEADAVVCERSDAVVLVRTADCVPVLLSSLDGARVAAVHAGWRGLVAGVVEHAARGLGATDPLAAVGPCLSLERFEVGPEVAEAFLARGHGEAIHSLREGRIHVDLRAAVAEELRRAGVRRIETTDRCTWTHAEEFYSHRRDVTHGGQTSTGRLAALIGPVPHPVRDPS